MYEQDQTRPYNRPQTSNRLFLHQFKHGSSPGRLAIFAVITGVLGIALGAASLSLVVMYKSTVATQTAQIDQLQRAVSNAQTAGQANASTLSGLSGKVSVISSGMAAIAPFNQVCSQALVSQSGSTGLYYFPCSPAK